MCSIPECDNPATVRGWCNAHYHRWQRYGDPLGGRSTYRGSVARYFHEVVLTYEGDACLFWPFAKSKTGYARMRHGGHNRMVSRVVCECVNGPPPSPTHEAAHSCGNGHLGCVAKHHLRWATSKENKNDMKLHGTTARGERHAFAKLTEADARAIIALRGKLKQREIADQFSVNRSVISRIHTGIRWGHLPRM